MQIVIDIPKTDYEACKEQVKMIEQEGVFYESSDYALKKSIAKGIRIPKGHGRLIDADETISNICGSSCGCHLEECGHDEPCCSVARIESAPTIIEADKESEGKG